MNSAQRDAVLRMLLPALAVVVLYFFGFNQQAQLTAAYAQLEGAKAAAVSDEAILPVQQQLFTETAKHPGLKTEKDALEARWTRLASLRSNDSFQRANALQQLTKMLWDRGLVPYEESAETGNMGGGQLPGSFSDMVQKISVKKEGQPVAPAQQRLWRIRFYGRYRDVAATLSMLGDTDLALVPVGLTMSEAHPDTDWRVWTLLLWN
jgi:hypothetical protein